MRLRAWTNGDPTLATVVGALGLSTFVGAACNIGDLDTCTRGTEGCGCVQNDCIGSLICNADLMCVPNPAGGDVEPEDGDTGATSAGATDGGKGDDDDGGGGDGGDSDGGVDTGTSTPGGPQITDVTVEQSELLTSSDPSRILVEVTDPGGVDDIDGGAINAPDGYPMALFQKVGGGKYVATLSWSDFSTLELALGFEVEVELEFFDVDGNTATVIVPILVCSYAHDSVCDGACTDTENNPNHCGSCFNKCEGNDYCYYDFCYEDYYYAAQEGNDDTDTIDAGAAIPVDVPPESASPFFAEARPDSAGDIDPAAYALGR